MDSQEVDQLNFAYLNMVRQPSSPSGTWNVHVQVNGHNLAFKLDTVTEVTAVPEVVFYSMGHTQLYKPSKWLCGPDSHPLEVPGSITAEFCHNQPSNPSTWYPLNALHNATTTHLKFPRLFEGLSTMPGAYGTHSRSWERVDRRRGRRPRKREDRRKDSSQSTEQEDRWRKSRSREREDRRRGRSR